MSLIKRTNPKLPDPDLRDIQVRQANLVRDLGIPLSLVEDLPEGVIECALSDRLQRAELKKHQDKMIKRLED